MPLKCNITTTGRVARLLLGLVAIVPAMVSSVTNLNLTLGLTASVAFGAFAIFEAAEGWCVVVETLERLRRGITRNGVLRALLGASAE